MKVVPSFFSFELFGLEEIVLFVVSVFYEFFV